jgi:cysteine desulfurase/selenocysteine lyase
MSPDPRPFIYMNNAATSWPKPPEVHEALAASLSSPPFGSGRTTGNQGEDYVTQARGELSDFLAADPPEHVVFTHNATDALNLLIQGFLAGVPKGGDVLTTGLEHNSVLRPLHEYRQQGRIRLSILPFEDGRVHPETVKAAIRPGTKLMVMTHGSNVLGTLQDIRTIGEILQERGIYVIIDGAQTAGHVPIRLQDLPLDAFVFTGHKALLGVPGTGGFYLKEPEAILPVRFGGTGTNSRSLSHPREMPERFEAGTPNTTGLAALAAGVRFLRTRGIAPLAEKAERQTSFILRELGKEPTIILYQGHPELPIIAFNIQGLRNEDVGFMLARAYGIVTRTGLHCAPLMHQAIDGGEGCVRLSLSWATTDEECRIAANAIREIAQHADHKVSAS